MYTYSPKISYDPSTERVQGQELIYEHLAKAHALSQVLLKLQDIRCVFVSILHDYLWAVDEHISEALSQCTVIQVLKDIGRAPDKTHAQDETYKCLGRAEVIISRLLKMPNLTHLSNAKLLKQVRGLDQELNTALHYADLTFNGVLAHERKSSH